MSLVPLEQAGDEAAFGGKASQLAAALRRGLPVPPGFALSARSAALVSGGDRAALRALRDMLKAFGRDRLAVRSSAVGEDSAGASFAGQHDTCLNVAPGRVPQAVAQVWRSVTAGPAAAYRRRLGLGHEAATGVVVQELVAADVAGVLFTRDPLSGADERVIEASWGLGEAVVAGQVVPDRYRLARDGTVLERHPGLKDALVALDAGGGTTVRAVDGAAAHRLCLDDADLAALGALATACEEAFAGPRDIEWALASGRLWLLQARPITAGG